MHPVPLPKSTPHDPLADTQHGTPPGAGGQNIGLHDPTDAMQPLPKSTPHDPLADTQHGVPPVSPGGQNVGLHVPVSCPPMEGGPPPPPPAGKPPPVP
jgi:hypothetical protein